MSARVLGEGLPSYVNKQIDIRQESLGKLTKTNEDLTVFNASTPWIRFASSVNISGSSDNTAFLPESSNDGNALAVEYTLKSIPLDAQGVYGKDTPFSESSNSAASTYGNTFNPEYGLKPAPGVTDVKIQALNNGSIRQATVNLKCFSPAQFKVVQALYMRLKYTMLLEWGHSQYLDNNGSFVTAYQLEDIYGPFIDGTKSYLEILNLIEKNREKSAGNYDAFLGKIVNFSFQYQTDGTYNITLTLLSQGDVIESLRINSTLPDTILDTPTTSIEVDEEAVEEIRKQLFERANTQDGTNTNNYSGVETSRINFITDQIASGKTTLIGNETQLQEELADVGTEEAQEIDTPLFTSQVLTPVADATTLGRILNNLKINTVANARIKGKQGKTSTEFLLTAFPNPGFTLDPVLTNEVAEKGGTLVIYNEKHTDSSPCYIRFGYLMYILQTAGLVYDKNTPIVTTYNSSGWKDIKIRTQPAQLSSDPDKVWLRQSALNPVDKTGYDFRDSENPYFGYLYQLMVNVDFVKSLFEKELTDGKNRVNLYSFCKALIEGINSSLGGINDIRVAYDHDTNEVFFYEKGRITETLGKKLETRLRLDGVKIGEAGSFVRDVSLTSQLTSAMQTMASLGRNRATSAQDDSSIFKSINVGFVDRIDNELNDYIDEDEATSPTTPVVNIASWLLYSNQLYQNYTFDPKEISAFTNLNATVQRLISQEHYKEGHIDAPNFIPFNLGITLHGISGIKLLQELVVDEYSQNIIPFEFKGRLSFIVQGIGHTVNSQAWTTEITTFTVSLAGSNNKDGNVYNKETDLEILRQAAIRQAEDQVEEPSDLEDPAPIINPSRIGGTDYKNSLVATNLKKDGFFNAKLPIDKLTPIQEYGADTRYYTDGKFRLHPDAALAYQKWIADMKSQGIEFTLSSAYRNLTHQNNLSGKVAATPGTSAHGWGGAVDFSNLYRLVRGSTDPTTNQKARKNNEVYKQIAEVGAKYGWYNPWRLSDTSGTRDEIWHFEYWGESSTSILISQGFETVDTDALAQKYWSDANK